MMPETNTETTLDEVLDAARDCLGPVAQLAGDLILLGAHLKTLVGQHPSWRRPLYAAVVPTLRTMSGACKKTIKALEKG